MSEQRYILLSEHVRGEPRYYVIQDRQHPSYTVNPKLTLGECESAVWSGNNSMRAWVKLKKLNRASARR